MEACIEEAHLPGFGSPCLLQDFKDNSPELGIYKMAYVRNLYAILKVHKINIYITSQVTNLLVISCHFHQSSMHS